MSASDKYDLEFDAIGQVKALLGEDTAAGATLLLPPPPPPGSASYRPALQCTGRATALCPCDRVVVGGRQANGGVAVCAVGCVPVKPRLHTSGVSAWMEYHPLPSTCSRPASSHNYSSHHYSGTMRCHAAPPSLSPLLVLLRMPPVPAYTARPHAPS